MPANTPPVGIFILGDVPPKNIVPLSRQVEACGFSELWFAEDYFMLSGFSSAAMASSSMAMNSSLLIFMPL